MFSFTSFSGFLWYLLLFVGSQAQHIQLNSNHLPQYSIFSPPSIPFWKFLGDTEANENYIRLTPDRQSKAGAIWNSEPFYADNWEATFSFKVHGVGNLGADGLAFWYTERSNTLGKLYGNVDIFKGLGLILDTYDNDGTGKHPLLFAVVGDGMTSFGHDDHSHGHGKNNMEYGSCQIKCRNSNIPNLVKVIYNYGRLIVQTSVDNEQFKQCIDANIPPLPAGYHFGFSAATGQLADNHDILHFSVTSKTPLFVNDVDKLQYLLIGSFSKLELQLNRFIEINSGEVVHELVSLKNSLREVVDVLLDEQKKGDNAQLQNVISSQQQLRNSIQTNHNTYLQQIQNLARICENNQSSSSLPWILCVILFLLCLGLGVRLVIISQESRKKFF